MRDFKGIKRQRNRNRNGGGGGKPQHNTNRAFESNGPDGVKVRGAAQHVYEKYQQLARDAHTTGDRVLAENHLQHAEHYFRVLRAMQPQRPLSDIVGRDQFASGYDIDFEDESGGHAEAGEADAESANPDQENERGGERHGDDRGYRDPRQRDEWRGEDRFERGGERQDRGFRGQRDDRFRDDRQRGRDDRRFERPDRGERPERSERFDRDRFDRGEPRQNFRSEQAEPRPSAVSEAPAEPAGPVLRADDGDVSHAPAFLQSRPEEPREPRRPRRRRTSDEVGESPESGEA